MRKRNKSKLRGQNFSPGSGQLNWAAHIKGNMVYRGSHALDNAGGLFAGARFSNTADFDPGPGTVNLSANGVSYAYFLKLQYSGTVGIKELGAEALGSAWPNPFTSELHVPGLNSETKIELLSVDGKVLESKLTNEKEMNLNTEELPAGVYFLKASNKEKVSIGRW